MFVLRGTVIGRHFKGECEEVEVIEDGRRPKGSEREGGRKGEEIILRLFPVPPHPTGGAHALACSS